MSLPSWTPIQQRLLALLSDGMYHHQSELLEQIDSMADSNMLNQHLFKLREKLRPMGEVIITEKLGGVVRYRHCRVISIAE